MQSVGFVQKWGGFARLDWMGCSVFTQSHFWNHQPFRGFRWSSAGTFLSAINVYLIWYFFHDCWLCKPGQIQIWTSLAYISMFDPRHFATINRMNFYLYQMAFAPDIGCGGQRGTKLYIQYIYICWLDLVQYNYTPFEILCLVWQNMGGLLKVIIWQLQKKWMGPLPGGLFSTWPDQESAVHTTPTGRRFSKSEAASATGPANGLQHGVFTPSGLGG